MTNHTEVYRITFIQKMTYLTLMIILLGCSKDADPVAEIDLTLKQQIAQKILAKPIRYEAKIVYQRGSK